MTSAAARTSSSPNHGLSSGTCPAKRSGAFLLFDISISPDLLAPGPDWPDLTTQAQPPETQQILQGCQYDSGIAGGGDSRRPGLVGDLYFLHAKAHVVSPKQKLGGYESRASRDHFHTVQIGLRIELCEMVVAQAQAEETMQHSEVDVRNQLPISGIPRPLFACCHYNISLRQQRKHPIQITEIQRVV